VASKAPPPAGVPAGLEGMSAPRILPAGAGRWLIVADAPLNRYAGSVVNRRLSDLGWVGERAMEHERVVEFFTRHGTVVPMKLFTLFTGDEKAVADVRGRRGLARLLSSLAGREEWGVRVAVDPGRLRRRIREQASRPVAGLSAGTGFLVQRQREQSAVRGGMDDARRRAEEVFSALEAIAAEARRRDPSAVEGASLLLDGAFLVERTRAAEFTDAARALAGRHAPEGVSVVLTGPWPPYNFLAPSR
jgi:Gas vesicle synthesis protein GvpL/GvpF